MTERIIPLQSPRDGNWDRRHHEYFSVGFLLLMRCHYFVACILLSSTVHTISSLPTYDAFENLASSPCANPKFSRVEDVKEKIENVFLANLTAEADE
jgi:hypothetical protein